MFGFFPSKDELLDNKAELNKDLQSIKNLTTAEKTKFITQDNFKLLTQAVITNSISIFNDLTDILKSTQTGTKNLKEFLSTRQFQGAHSFDLEISATFYNFEMCKNIVKLILDMELDLKEILKTANYTPFSILLGLSQHNIILDNIDSDPISFIAEILIESSDNRKFDFIESVINVFDTKSLISLYNKVEKKSTSSKDTELDLDKLVIDALVACCKQDKINSLKYILHDKKNQISIESLQQLFSVACKNGSFNSAKYLVENYIKKDPFILKRIMDLEINYETIKLFPLHMSIQKGKIDVTKYLLSLIISEKLLTKNELTKILQTNEQSDSLNITLDNNRDGDNSQLNIILHLIDKNIITTKVIDNNSKYKPFLAKIPKFLTHHKLNGKFSFVPKFKPLVDITLAFKKIKVVTLKKDFSKLITPDSEYLLKIASFISGGSIADVEQNMDFIIYHSDDTNNNPLLGENTSY